jgi:HK97 family phage prohead protease
MDKILHVASTFKSVPTDDGSVMIRGMASTNHSDRAGDVITPDAWSKGGLENFKNNPVILFNHDYNRPIGRATGVKITDTGLELEAKISKAAKDVCDLVKDGVLGAFSVGFKCKDADYIEETDGLKIKDAELFEVSVVTVPCNQAATFSLAKSFDSIAEYEEFKKTFTNRVDLTGQSLTSNDSIESNVVSDAPKQVEKSTVKETKMSEDTKTPEIDLEAFAKKVADETAAKIAMKQAEQKAAEEAEAKAAAEAAEQKAAQEEQVKSTIRTGIETGAEKLMADMQADMEKASVDQIAEVTAKYEAQLKEKSEELEQMRQSKRHFADRSSFEAGQKATDKDIMYAHVLGQITGKGFNTQYGKEVLEKASTFATNYGTASTSSDGQLDMSVSNAFEEEVRLDLRAASLFREIPVTSGATILPVSSEPAAADFNSGIPTTNSGILETSGNTFPIGKVTLIAKRLVSATFIDKDTDEQLAVGLLPMITSALARAHAKAIDGMIINGVTGITGLVGHDAGTPTDIAATGSVDEVVADDILTARAAMGKYGINPEDLGIICSVEAYNDLLSDTAFADITQVGSTLAQKVTGTVGTIFGSPVVVTDSLSGKADGNIGVMVVNRQNFVIPRLRGVSIETDYEVANQRTALVASQSLGFNQIIDSTSGVVSLAYTAG